MMKKNFKNQENVFHSLCLPTNPIKKTDNNSSNNQKIKYERVKQYI